MFEFTPVIIIGAGRSGTNILRDSLCRIEGFDTWRCDEINPIWRHGNTVKNSDVLTAADASADIKNYIRSKFVAQWKKTGKPDFLVEKTCANSLRVDFVSTIIPEALFIYIVRNGTDVVASAGKRWRGEIEVPTLSYFTAKVRNTPLTDLPIYVKRFIQGRMSMYFKRKEHMSFWGPQFPGLSDFNPDTPLFELCAHQWVACVNSSDDAFRGLDKNRWTKIYYENFVSNQRVCIDSMLEFIGANCSDVKMDEIVSSIHPDSVGNAGKLKEQLSGSVHNIMAMTMERHGYILDE